MLSLFYAGQKTRPDPVVCLLGIRSGTAKETGQFTHDVIVSNNEDEMNTRFASHSQGDILMMSGINSLNSDQRASIRGAVKDG